MRRLFGKKRKLFKLFGITVSVELSVLVIFSLLLIGLGPYFQMGLAESNPQILEAFPLLPWLLAIVAVLMFFASIVFHEYAHSLLAKKFGAKVEEIHLFMFGGASLIHHTENSNTPKKNFAIAVIGPVSSIFLALVFLSMFFASSIFIGSAAGAIVGQVLFYLVLINTALAVFNAVPMFPLDGGRAAVAVMRMFGMKETKATIAGANLGVVLSLALVAFGLSGFFVEAWAPHIWLVLIGFFILMLNRAEAGAAKTKEAVENKLQDLRVRYFYRAYPDSFSATIEGDDLYCDIDDDVISVLPKLHKYNDRGIFVTQGSYVVGSLHIDDVLRVIEGRNPGGGHLPPRR